MALLGHFRVLLHLVELDEPLRSSKLPIPHFLTIVRVAFELFHFLTYLLLYAPFFFTFSHIVFSAPPTSFHVKYIFNLVLFLSCWLDKLPRPAAMLPCAHNNAVAY
jgi:hypothetical protein